MPLLFYWQRDNYLRDRAHGFGYHPNQSSPVMLAAQPGESVWAITQRRSDRVYVLAAAELIVKVVTRNPPGYRYGTHRAWGDLERTRYFDTDDVPDVGPVIRRLSVQTNAEHLGQSFQGPRGVRVITAQDHQLLVAAADGLPRFTGAGVYAEDVAAARLINSSAVVSDAPADPATAKRRREYLYEHVRLARDRRLVLRLQELYGGRCQVCLYDPLAVYRVHQWLSRGGEDDLENLALLCPNHHAAVHRDDAPFDYADLSFRFSGAPAERVNMNLHLPVAA